jgi:hypothetical protein
MLVAKTNGNIDIIECKSFQRLFEIEKAMASPINFMSECKRGSNYLGNLLVAS